MKPQDVLVALRLCCPDIPASYAEKAADLGISASEIHAAERRLIEARLLNTESKTVNRDALIRFLVNGVPFAFATKPTEQTRGIPTAWAAPALRGKFNTDSAPPPVWPDPQGTVQGVSVEPLYRSVPKAIKNSSLLYELLSLVDALRIGRARERNLAEIELKKRLTHNAGQ